MTDGPGTAGDDLQRPLDESVPIDTAGGRNGGTPEHRAAASSGADSITDDSADPAIGGSADPAASTGDTAPADAVTPTDETAPIDAVTPTDDTEPADDTGPAEDTAPADDNAPTDDNAPAEDDAPAEDTASTDDTVALRSAVPAGSGAPKTRVINLDATAAMVVRHARTVLPVRAARAGGLATIRTSRRVLAWSHRPTGRFIVPGVVLAALIGGAIAAGAYVIPTTGVADLTAPGATASVPPFGTVVPGTQPTVGPPVIGGVNPTAPPATGGFSNAAVNPPEVLTGWAQTTTALTGVPMIALRAYGYAELVLASAMPTCQLRWTTLAAIGQVESNHGSTGGASLLPNGQALPAIRGPALDGTGGTMLIQDTDGGQLDGDPTFDRAVGPMQFIPQTWYVQADPLRGISDVNNINDAALAAGYYLCGSGRDLSTAEDWWAAILSYNNVQSYANAVFGYANDYGQRSNGGTA